MLTLAKFLAVNYHQALSIINNVNQTLPKVLEEFGVASKDIVTNEITKTYVEYMAWAR